MFGLHLGLQTNTVFGPSFVGALDSYMTNLDAAWSVARRLLTSYTGALIRVRRSSDNTEQDIGYAADGSLDTTALLAFVGANNGFVTRIYAQSSGKDFVNTTAASQPRIVNAGSLVTIGSNNKPAIEVVTANVQCMSTSAFTTVTGSSLTMAAYMRLISTASGSRLVSTCATGNSDSSGTGGWLPSYETNPGIASFDGTDRASLTLSLPRNLAFAGTCQSTGHILRRNGSSNTSTFTPTANDYNHYLLWCYSTSTALCKAGSEFAEAAVWTANRDADMTAWISNLETFYGT